MAGGDPERGVPAPSEHDCGRLVGLLAGEGHFGGDGRQPHVTLRMHVRHESTFRWLERTFPGGRLYGPYNHSGREYFQWMARGAYLRDALLPIFERLLTPEFSAYGYERLQDMCERYRTRLRPALTEGSEGVSPYGSP